MNATLVDEYGDVMQIKTGVTEADIAALNERAQDVAGMEWRPATAQDWFELGKTGALFACVNFGERE